MLFMKHIKAFIVPIKLSEYDRGLFIHLIQKYGGEVCDQKQCNIIFTALKSPKRIARHVFKHKIPVVDSNWIVQCDVMHECLPLTAYRLHMPYESNDILNMRFSSAPPEEIASDTIETDSDSSEDEDEDLAPEFMNTKYACLRPTPDQPKYNHRLISLLSLIEKKRELDGEEARATSYRHLISALKTYPGPLRSVKVAEKIVGVGARMKQKIRQFINTGVIQEADALRHDEQFRTIRLFTQVYGVGHMTAQGWWDLGYRTLQDVLDHAQLTKSVRLAIELFPQLVQKIDRLDAQEMIDIIQSHVIQINPSGAITPTGSYRRGKLEISDLDLIISAPIESLGTLVNTLLNTLSENGLLKHIFSHSRGFLKKTHISYGQDFSSEPELYTCAIIQPSKGILRQVDLVVVEPDHFATALLGWTGSRHFEKSLRDYAKKEKSITLSNQAIFYTYGTEKRDMLADSEEEIFRILGVPYLDPTLRNC
ncbi:unnamed protein product [Rhizopus stolonifer]